MGVDDNALLSGIEYVPLLRILLNIIESINHE